MSNDMSPATASWGVGFWAGFGWVKQAEPAERLRRYLRGAAGRGVGTAALLVGTDAVHFAFHAGAPHMLPGLAVATIAPPLEEAGEGGEWGVMRFPKRVRHRSDVCPSSLLRAPKVAAPIVCKGWGRGGAIWERFAHPDVAFWHFFPAALIGPKQSFPGVASTQGERAADRHVLLQHVRQVGRSRHARRSSARPQPAPSGQGVGQGGAGPRGPRGERSGAFGDVGAAPRVPLAEPA